MSSKISSAVRILKKEGPISLGKQAKRDLFPARDRLREVQGPAADVYDCFTFYNELDILEIRLNELDDIVDKFVIVEATETFQGEPKKLYFEENKSRYSEFSDKIIHHVVEYPDGLDGAWEREYYLRDSIQTALRRDSTIKIQDEIIVSDADEVPNPERIKHAIKYGGVKVFSQSLHYYYFNSVISDGSRWFGPVMARYGDFSSPQDFRDRYTQHIENPGGIPFWMYKTVFSILLSVANRTPVRIISEGGWHFSYLGDVEYIIDKIETFSHTELNKEEFKDRERIERAMRAGKDVFGQGLEFENVELDDSFPRYLLDNRERFSEHIPSSS